MDFWCEGCRRWTPSEPAAYYATPHLACCSNCGEMYGCGECGAAITLDGSCTAHVGHDL
jgi:hypothetical protein